ncbi:hypothetical protein ZHAS_00015290 [Anopheles sinensis]|uniref:Uncharacterized protein n=1 Tax=Anopheles sinensis TaxID=74873 RepID=A0A084WAL9_ANOSI|nr:hypothetical protein ZHAS_00015290 [Anopheles sinensis]
MRVIKTTAKKDSLVHDTIGPRSVNRYSGQLLPDEERQQTIAEDASLIGKIKGFPNCASEKRSLGRALNGETASAYVLFLLLLQRSAPQLLVFVHPIPSVPAIRCRRRRAQGVLAATVSQLAAPAFSCAPNRTN